MSVWSTSRSEQRDSIPSGLFKKMSENYHFIIWSISYGGTKSQKLGVLKDETICCIHQLAFGAKPTSTLFTWIVFQFFRLITLIFLEPPLTISVVSGFNVGGKGNRLSGQCWGPSGRTQVAQKTGGLRIFRPDGRNTQQLYIFVFRPILGFESLFLVRKNRHTIERRLERL